LLITSNPSTRREDIVKVRRGEIKKEGEGTWPPTSYHSFQSEKNKRARRERGGEEEGEKGRGKKLYHHLHWRVSRGLVRRLVVIEKRGGK